MYWLSTKYPRVVGSLYRIDLEQIKREGFAAVSGPEGSAWQYKKKFTKIRVPRGPLGGAQNSPQGLYFQKMFFERGVQSTRNDLIRLETLSWKCIFSQKKFGWTEIFSKNGFWRGVQPTRNDQIRLETLPWKCILFQKKGKIFGDEKFFQKWFLEGGSNRLGMA